MRTPWLCVAFCGCITEGTRPAADTFGADTQPSDSGGGAIEDSSVSDGTPGEGIEPSDGVGPEEAVGPEDSGGGVEDTDAVEPDSSVGSCVGVGDCAGTLPACRVWGCVDSHCVLQPVFGGNCNDGDRCTEGDFCDEGSCRGSYLVDCAYLAGPCRTSTEACDSQRGCVFENLSTSTSCTPPGAPSAGTCVAGWRIGEGACDGEGNCIGSPIPSDHPLDGAWHAVLMEVGNTRPHRSLAANFDLDAGAITASHVVSTSTELSALLTAEPGSFCTETNGPVDFAFGELRYRGIADNGSRYLIFDRLDDQMIGLAVRRGGRVADVSGRYRVVVVEHLGDAVNTLLTRQGRADLTAGCLDEPFTLNGPVTPNLIAEPSAGGSCFEPGIDGLSDLAFDIDLGDGPFYTYDWVGAVAPGGDAVLLTRRDAGFGFGLVLMVRERDNSPPSVAGDWSFVSLRGGITGINQSFNAVIYENGALSLGADESDFSGTLVHDGSWLPITGDWYAVDNDGRYSQRASFGSAQLHHTGIVSEGDVFIAAWVAEPPQEDPLVPNVLSSRPFEGSILFAVRSPVGLAAAP